MRKYDAARMSVIAVVPVVMGGSAMAKGVLYDDFAANGRLPLGWRQEQWQEGYSSYQKSDLPWRRSLPRPRRASVGRG